MNTPLIDQKARDMAQAAISAISNHEGICAQRWASTMATMSDIKRILAWAGVTLVGSLGTIIILLLSRTH